MHKWVGLVLLFWGCGLLLPTDGFAQNNSRDVALMLKAAGQVEVKTPGRNTWSPGRKGVRLHSGEVVRTGENSLAALIFTDDKTLLKVRENSSVTIQGKREENRISKTLSLNFGQLWSKVTRQNTSMRVETPSGVATVKGTEFNCSYVNNVFMVYCREGLMEVFNQLGQLLLGAEEMARLERGSPPQRVQGDPSQYFDLSDDEEGGTIEIEFEDADGNKKRLILQF